MTTGERVICVSDTVREHVLAHYPRSIRVLVFRAASTPCASRAGRGRMRPRVLSSRNAGRRWAAAVRCCCCPVAARA
jgi:hypothetical protein